MSMFLSSGSGLRERKKRETHNAIELAAVSLARENGHSRVTVAHICERADVSRSTFFNYMPSRESAIFGSPIVLADPDVIEQVLVEGRDVPLTTRALRIVFASVGHSWVNAEVSAGRLCLSIEQPDAEVLVAGPVTKLLTELSDFLAGWLERHPEHRVLPSTSPEREASYLVSLTGTAFRATLLDLTGTGDTQLSEEIFEAAIDEIIAVAAARNPREPGETRPGETRR